MYMYMYEHDSGVLSVPSSLARSERDYDPEQFADQELPILIVGTKLVSVVLVHDIAYTQYLLLQTDTLVIVAALGSNGWFAKIIVQYQQCGRSFQYQCGKSERLVFTTYIRW